MTRFFSLRPRIGVRRWLVWGVATLGMTALGVAMLAGQGGTGAALVAIGAAIGLALGKLAIESVRRLHDIGQSGGVGLAVGIGIAALLATAALNWPGRGPDVLGSGAVALAAIALGVLVLRPGTRGDNAYGPPPAGLGIGGASDGGAGALVAALFVAGGIAAGIGVLAWQAEGARQREQRMRAPAPVVDAGPTTANDADPLANANAATSDRIDTLLANAAAR